MKTQCILNSPSQVDFVWFVLVCLLSFFMVYMYITSFWGDTTHLIIVPCSLYSMSSCWSCWSCVRCEESRCPADVQSYNIHMEGQLWHIDISLPLLYSLIPKRNSMNPYCHLRSSSTVYGHGVTPHRQVFEYLYFLVPRLWEGGCTYQTPLTVFRAISCSLNKIGGYLSNPLSTSAGFEPAPSYWGMD